MRIEKAVEVTDELLSALTRLIFQLAPEKTPPTRDDLASILNSPAHLCWSRVCRMKTMGSLGF